MSLICVGARRILSTTHHDLLEAALAGDRRAARELVDALAPVIRARVARVIHARAGFARGRELNQEYDDLMGEAWRALFQNDWAKLRSWRPEGGLSLRNYVGLIAERETISALRSRKRSPWTEDPTEESDFGASHAQTNEEQVASRQLLGKVLDCLRLSLSVQGLQIFRRLYLDEETPSALAEELSTTVDALYVWRSRIKKAARKCFSQLS